MMALFKRLRKDEKFAFTRDYKAKRTGLGIQFGMGYRKLYQLNRDDFENETEAKVCSGRCFYSLFPGIKRGQDEVKRRASEDKRLVNKYGAIRHFYDVERWDRKQQKMVAGEQAEQAVAFLPASHAFGHVRDCLLRIRERGWDERYGLVNSIHDSLLFHCPLSYKDEAIAEVKGELEKASKILIYPSMAPDGLWTWALTLCRATLWRR